MIELKCEFCSRIFCRSQGAYRRNLRLEQRICCSRLCAVEIRRKREPGSCLRCGACTKNLKFCSRSCTASYNNKKFPKRKLEGSCSCGSPIPKRNKFCSECWISHITNLTTNLTLNDVRMATGSRNSYRTAVGHHARKVAKSLGLLNNCRICGYSKHVHCCHLKPISSFPETAKLVEVNSPTNLEGLCPNHHWELDNNQLDRSLIENSEN